MDSWLLKSWREEEDSRDDVDDKRSTERRRVQEANLRRETYGLREKAEPWPAYESSLENYANTFSWLYAQKGFGPTSMKEEIRQHSFAHYPISLLDIGGQGSRIRRDVEKLVPVGRSTGVTLIDWRNDVQKEIDEKIGHAVRGDNLYRPGLYTDLQEDSRKFSLILSRRLAGSDWTNSFPLPSTRIFTLGMIYRILEESGLAFLECGKSVAKDCQPNGQIRNFMKRLGEIRRLTDDRVVIDSALDTNSMYRLVIRIKKGAGAPKSLPIRYLLGAEKTLS